jgi:hypothetical protein
MPALSEVAAFIIDGVVMNVGALSTDNDYTAAHAALADQFDEIRIVPRAGIGWKVTPDGLRPDKPDDTTWAWDDTNGWWDRPVPYPNDGGDYVWDEGAQDWKPAPVV